MPRYALAPVARIDCGWPARLDGRPYWGSGRLARALAAYREENGFTSWVFCTEWQARQHGYRVPRDQRDTCLKHQYETGGWTRFYSADQLETASVRRACVEFDFDSIAGLLVDAQVRGQEPVSRSLIRTDN